GAVPATIFFKEVGYLDHLSQLRLLDLMEDGIFQNGTGKKNIKNLRFISSTSEDLEEKVAQGKFSEDLYYRLNTLSIYIPPLRERVKEIPKIAQFFLTQHAPKMKIKKVGISDKVLNLLQNYWWPGNLRELEHVILRSALFSEGDHLMEKDLLFETENEKNSFIEFLKKGEIKPISNKKNNYPEEKMANLLSLFFIELVHRIKNPLVSIKTFTQLLRDKFNDMEFREQFYRIVTEDIEKIDSLLNGLLNYIRINTPIEKANTIHSILEDTLRRHEPQLENKKIKVFKKYEKDLPEAIIHDEQLRYILNTIFQYALPSIPPQGSIGLLTKSILLQKETGNDKPPSIKDGRYVEILIIYTGFKKSVEPFKNVLGIPVMEKEEAIELELRLIKEIIQRNRGIMKFEVDEKKPRTLISLRFPVERRKVLYYQLPNI
ncbi:MAG: sigma 54-interacting transcriptional regulator, partial [Thermodesulfobacteriota bacterium]